MENRRRSKLALLLALLPGLVMAQAQENPETGAFAPAQIAADQLASFSGTDAAFLAAGLIKTSYRKEDLSSLLQFPGEDIVIVKLTGAQVRQAFERALSLHPQPNTSFLQISGFEVTFNPNLAVGKRVVSVTAKGSSLNDTKEYEIAMPASLGRGGLGYFKIWDKTKIIRTVKGTVGDALSGKAFSSSQPRWVSQS